MSRGDGLVPQQIVWPEARAAVARFVADYASAPHRAWWRFIVDIAGTGWSFVAAIEEEIRGRGVDDLVALNLSATMLAVNEEGGGGYLSDRQVATARARLLGALNMRGAPREVALIALATNLSVSDTEALAIVEIWRQGTKIEQVISAAALADRFSRGMTGAHHDLYLNGKELLDTLEMAPQLCEIVGVLAASHGLGKLGVADSETLRWAIGRLASADKAGALSVDERCALLGAVGACGKGSKPARDIVRQHLVDADAPRELLATAAQALGQIATVDELEVLDTFLGHSDALVSLGGLAGLSEAVHIEVWRHDVVMRLRNDEDLYSRQFAAAIAGQSRTAAEALRDILFERSTCELHADVLDAIGVALSRCGPVSEIIPELISRIREKNVAAVTSCGAALRELGPVGMRMLIEALIEHDELALRAVVLGIVRDVGRASSALCEEVGRGLSLTRLSDESCIVLLAALACQGMAALVALPAVLDKYLTGSPAVCLQAEAAIQAMGPGASWFLENEKQAASPQVAARIDAIIGWAQPRERSVVRRLEKVSTKVLQTFVVVASYLSNMPKSERSSLRKLAAVVDAASAERGIELGGDPSFIDRMFKTLRDNVTEGAAVHIAAPLALTKRGTRLLSEVRRYLHDKGIDIR